jgi:hypothetical protein
MSWLFSHQIVIKGKKSLISDSARYCFVFFLILIIHGCNKVDERFYTETDRSIRISDNITVDNGFTIRDHIFNINTYKNFLSCISSSDHFIIVPLKDFAKTNSTDKVILSLRYDMDENITAAVKFAYREHHFGIQSSYFVLHTADYYGKIIGSTFYRNENVLSYLKKIQDYFGQEIGFHNDLVTLQVVYGMDSREYLRNELDYLRSNGINIYGTTYHGSKYCYIYKYYNAYFWKEYPSNGWNYESIDKGFDKIIIEKDSLKTYNFEYEGGLLHPDYFFTDVNHVNNKRWNMSMVNLDTIQPGKKVIILLHPALWD